MGTADVRSGSAEFQLALLNSPPVRSLHVSSQDLKLKRQWGSRKESETWETHYRGRDPEVLRAVRACIVVKVLHDTPVKNSCYIERVHCRGELTVR